MEMKLTKRQLETLRSVHRFIVENGFPPTIKELRTPLDVSSDQAVIELLERLETQGFLARDRGQARGMQITKKGRLVLGVDSASSSGTVSVAEALQMPLELTRSQKKVFEKLSEIDEKLGRMYRGALRVLEDPYNDDAVAQSAHSMREIITFLGQKTPLPDEIKKKLKKNRNSYGTVTGLRHFFDPYGGKGLDETTYERLYDQFQKDLLRMAHHGSASAQELRHKLRDLDEFLLRYVFPRQVEVYGTIDRILREGPSRANPTDLITLITRNVESYRYFWTKADAGWLDFFRNNNMLHPGWDTGNYLARVAKSEPQSVLDVILEAKVLNTEPGTTTALALAITKLPPALAADGARKVAREKWIQRVEGGLLHQHLAELLKILIGGSQYGAASALAESLLDVHVHETSGSLVSARLVGAVDEYHYARIAKLLYEIPSEELVPFIRLLIDKLTRAISLVHASEDGSFDGSHIWRLAIENHEQNWPHRGIENTLIDAVRDLLERRVCYLKENSPASTAKEVDTLLIHEPAYPILDRFRLHLYRLEPNLFLGQIENVVLERMDDHNTWHEYARLVRETFPLLKESVKDRYLSRIDKGPKEESSDRSEDEWRGLRLALIKDHLSEQQRTVFRTWLDRAEGMEDPDFIVTRSQTWVGPQAPISENELESMTRDEMLTLMIQWIPPDGIFAPSRSGLGRLLRSVVEKSPEEFSKNAERLVDSRIRPVYVYQFLAGLSQSLNKDARLDWSATLGLTSSIIERARNGQLPEFKREEDMETGWDGVFEEIGRLLTNGMRNRKHELEIRFRERIWSIIEFLCEHPDPTPEHERKYGGNNTDPFNMSINTVRGEAFHALFAYVFWYDRNRKLRNKRVLPIIPPEVKPVLELHLDPEHDPSLTVRAVYGRYFPWLLIYGKEWAQRLIPLVFPSESVDLRYASWETYLSNNMFEEVYPALRAQYEQALRDLKTSKIPKRRYWVKPWERIAHHVMIAYAFGIDSEDDPFYKRFFHDAKGKIKGMAVSFAGRAWVNRDDLSASGRKVPDTEVLERFWEWRLKVSNSPRELEEFGWWIRKGTFDDEWMLERLLQTVEKTGGHLSADFHVVKGLSSLAEKYPLLCVKILFAIVKVRRSRFDFLHGYRREIESILNNTLNGKDPEGKSIAEDIVDYLTKLGFEQLRHLIRSPASAPDGVRGRDFQG